MKSLSGQSGSADNCEDDPSDGLRETASRFVESLTIVADSGGKISRLINNYSSVCKSVAFVRLNKKHYSLSDRIRCAAR